MHITIPGLAAFSTEYPRGGARNVQRSGIPMQSARLLELQASGNVKSSRFLALRKPDCRSRSAPGEQNELDIAGRQRRGVGLFGYTTLTSGQPGQRRI